MIGTWLLETFHTPLLVGPYAALMVLPAIRAMATTRETRGADLLQ